jgi:TonB family protein
MKKLLHLLIEPLRKIIDFRGRSTRTEYFVGLIGTYIIGLIIIFGILVLGNIILKPDLYEGFVSGATLIFMIPYLLVAISLTSRRLHDANLSAGYMGLYFLGAYFFTYAKKLNEPVLFLFVAFAIVSYLSMLKLLLIPSFSGKNFKFSPKKTIKKIPINYRFWIFPTLMLVLLVTVSYIFINNKEVASLTSAYLIVFFIAIFPFYYYIQKSNGFIGGYKRAAPPLILLIIIFSSGLTQDTKPEISSSTISSIKNYLNRVDKLVSDFEIEPKEDKKKYLSDDETYKYVLNFSNKWLDYDEELSNNASKAEEFINDGIFEPATLINKKKIPKIIAQYENLYAVYKSYLLEYEKVWMENLSLAKERIRPDIWRKYNTKTQRNIKSFKKHLTSRIKVYEMQKDFFIFMEGSINNYDLYIDNDGLIIMPDVVLKEFNEKLNLISAAEEQAEIDRYEYIKLVKSLTEKYIDPNDKSQATKQIEKKSVKPYVLIIAEVFASNRKYPAEAELKRLEGEVKLKVTIDELGKILAYKIVESSGHKELDNAAISSIKKSNPLPQPPKDFMGENNSVDLVVPFNFTLNK